MTSDFDEDGVADLATANCGDDSASIRLGPGAGGLGASELAMLPCPSLLDTADLDGDGHADLIAMNTAEPGRLQVSLGRGDGSFEPALAWDLLPWLGTPAGRGFAVGDLDGDGFADVVTASVGTHLYMRRGLGSGHFAVAQRLTEEPTPELHLLALADLDRDGHLDLLALDASEGAVHTWAGLGRATFAAGLSGGWRAPRAATRAAAWIAPT